MGNASIQLFRTIAVLATFTGVFLGVYLLMRERSTRLAIRSGLEDPFLNSASVADSRAATMRGPFSQRVLAPASKSAANLVYRFGPKGLAEQTRHRLVLAGLSERIDADTFFAISVASPVVVFAFLLALNAVGATPLLIWIAVPLTAFVPKMWLTRNVESRQKGIQLALPDTLDLLTIAVEAGLGFDAAISRVVASIPGPLSDELYRMLQELKIGVPRPNALKNLSSRSEVDDLDSFITAIAEADTFGIGIGKVLRVQAHQLRLKRSQTAEERAAKTPVKLLFPLLICIFPALRRAGRACGHRDHGVDTGWSLMPTSGEGRKQRYSAMSDGEVDEVLKAADEMRVSLGHRRLSNGLTVAETLKGLTSIIAALAFRSVPDATSGSPSRVPAARVRVIEVPEE